MPDEELYEQSLFDQAVDDESAEAPVIETTEEQPRDDAGRFAKEQAEESAEVIAEKPEGERTVIDDNAPLVPSWRLREVNDEKRVIADRLAALESEKQNWQRQPTLVKEPEKAAKPDPLLDPEGYETYIEQKLEERLLNNQRETSLQQAHRTYKAEFEEAYAFAEKNIDPALKARMQQSRDPGETLIQWHREQKTMREVGNDPNAWLEKKLAERLKDPAFLAKAVEQARGIAQPHQANGRPRIDLPPTLNGASRGSTRPSNDDLSDSELFEQATN